jgi:hypothetical protein
MVRLGSDDDDDPDREPERNRVEERARRRVVSAKRGDGLGEIAQVGGRRGGRRLSAQNACVRLVE